VDTYEEASARRWLQVSAAQSAVTMVQAPDCVADKVYSSHSIEYHLYDNLTSVQLNQSMSAYLISRREMFSLFPGPDHPWGWWGWSLRARCPARYNKNLQSRTRTTFGDEISRE